MAKLAEQFGRTVRALRKARGMTQARLAEKSSLSEEWIRRIERGSGAPSFDALEALANALSATVADLFSLPSAREQRMAKIDVLMAELDEPGLEWLEGLIRAAVAYPTR